MAKDYFAMIELIWGLLSKKTGSVNKVEYVPQKPSQKRKNTSNLWSGRRRRPKESHRSYFISS
ncbi:MAG: hypothetical protein RR683_01755 [Lachnospiraceae bacterium]